MNKRRNSDSGFPEEETIDVAESIGATVVVPYKRIKKYIYTNFVQHTTEPAASFDKKKVHVEDVLS